MSLHITTYRYDSRGRQLTTTYPGGRTVANTVDGLDAGNRVVSAPAVKAGTLASFGYTLAATGSPVP